MDIGLARLLVQSVTQQVHVSASLEQIARDLFARHGATPCERHDLGWCSDCWFGESTIVGDRTSIRPTYGYDTQGTPLVNVDIRGWDTELVRGR